MSANRKSKVQCNITYIIFSSLISYIIAILLSLIFSFCINKLETLPKYIPVFLIGSILVGALINGIICVRKTYLKGIVSGFIASPIYSIMILITLLIFSHYKLTTSAIFLFIGILLASIIGGIIGANFKRRK